MNRSPHYKSMFHFKNYDNSIRIAVPSEAYKKQTLYS